MIKTFTISNNNTDVLNTVCKKLKIDQENVVYASYDKFLFGFIYALAIKEKSLILFGEDENKKKTHEPIKKELSEIDYACIENKTDLNLILKNRNTINLTSVVGITKEAKKVVEELNQIIRTSK